MSDASVFNTLPGCLGYYKNPIPPNMCESCRYRKVCRRVISMERYKEILEKIEKLTKGE